MKILQINKFFFLKGGAERYFFDLSELLSRKGHQVATFSTKHPQNFPLSEQNNFPLYYDFSKREGARKEIKKAKNLFYNKEAKRKLQELIAKEKPDIAHLHNFFSHLSPSIVSALKKENVPIAMTLHDYKLFCPNYRFFYKNTPCFDCLNRKNHRSCLKKKCIKNSFLKSLGGYLEGKWHKDFLKTVEKIDVFFAPSYYIKEKAILWGIPKGKVVYLPNFVGNKEIKENKNKLRENYLLYFGRLSQEKGVEFLIKSFLKILNDLPGWKLKIAGQGPEEEKLKRLVWDREEIDFLGEIKGRELEETISQSYFVIVPSLWPENCPYNILESHLLNKPVLSSNLGGLTELIKNNQSGLVYQYDSYNDLKEKIIWFVRHPKKTKKMGKLGRAQVLKENNSENHYKKIINVYQRIKTN